MARIKKRGLDYFPIDTDLIHDRLMRRITKQKGDAALSVLLGTLSLIYGGEGYYVRAERYFYEDLAALFYEKTASEVRDILELAVEYGLFDAELYSKYGILTSADIQRQYLLSTKRRATSQLCPEYDLIERALPAAPADEVDPVVNNEEKELIKDSCNTNVALKGENVTNTPLNVTLMPHSTAEHSIAEHSVAQHSTAEKRIPPSSSFRRKGGRRKTTKEEEREEEEIF